MTQGISRKLLPDFFQISQFRVMMQEILRKLFPGQFHEYLPIKKYFPTKTGHESVQTEVWYQTNISGQNLDPYRWLTTQVMTQRLFRKLFSISGNIFQYLEIVSGNSSAPLPEFSEFQILFGSLDFGKSFRKIPWVMAEIVKIAFGKKIRKSSWVTSSDSLPVFSLQSALNLNVFIR